MAHIPPNINLMAWRAEQQSKQSRHLKLAILNAIILAIVVVILCHSLMSYELHKTNSQILFMQHELIMQQKLKENLLQTQKETSLLESRINLINTLHNQNQQTIQLLTQLSNITPAGIYLTSLTQVGKQVTLIGKTVSTSQLALLMQNIDQSLVLNLAKLNELKFNNINPPYQNDFVIVTNLASQSPLNKGH